MQRVAALNSQGENDDDSDGWSKESEDSVVDIETAAVTDPKACSDHQDMKTQVAQLGVLFVLLRCILCLFSCTYTLFCGKLNVFELCHYQICR